MKVCSAKAKGRRGQQLVVKWLLSLFPQLEPDDVVSCSMGSGGADIKLSPAAKRLFGYSIEVKTRKSFSIATDYEQAARHDPKAEPLLICKPDRKDPLVVISLDHFERLIQASV